MNLEETIRFYAKPVLEMHFFIKQEGSNHCVKSHSGRNLGCYPTAKGAKKRLKQVEYFKHMKAEDENFYGPNTGGMGRAKALDL